MTGIKIINGRFYINKVISNRGNSLSEGKLIGIYTDMCAFFDKNICDVGLNKTEFINNLNEWRGSGVNLITLGLQSPNPFGEYYKKARERDKSKNISFDSSALNPDGSLNFGFLSNAEEIINAADNSGIAVLVNILSPSCESIFEDEFAILNGIFNIAEWLLEKKFLNTLVNLTDISHTFYKSSVLNGDRIVNVLKSIREKVKDNIIFGAGIKTFAYLSAKNMANYINLSDFIPIFSINARHACTTKKMLENIYFLKRLMRGEGREVPIIMAKGDDLSERYGSYGKNNLTEALENDISWCYYDRDGFGLLQNQKKSIDWNKNSTPEKRRFFELAGSGQ